MKITRKNLEKLFQNCKYNPEKIGVALLKMEGYKVSTYNIVRQSMWNILKVQSKILSFYIVLINKNLGNAVKFLEKLLDNASQTC